MTNFARVETELISYETVVRLKCIIMGKYTFWLLFLSKLVTVLSNSDFISQRTFQQLSLFEGFKPNVSSLTLNPVGSDIQCTVRCSRDVTCNSVFITPGERKECALFDASFPLRAFWNTPGCDVMVRYTGVARPSGAHGQGTVRGSAALSIRVTRLKPRVPPSAGAQQN